MKRSSRFVVAGLLVACLGGGVFWALSDRARAEDKKKPDPAQVERARETVKMLDDLYKTAVVGITQTYVEKQADVPAATLAKQVFAAMHKKGYHNARLIDATGKPKNKENLPSTPFEKKAVSEMKAGKTYVEEIGEVDGKPVLRAATVVPSVMKQCAYCHGGKENRLLGTIVYEIPIK